MSTLARSVNAGTVARDSAIRRAISCCARVSSVTVTSPFAVLASAARAGAGVWVAAVDSAGDGGTCAPASVACRSSGSPSAAAGASSVPGSANSAIVAPTGSVWPARATIRRTPACSDSWVSVALSVSISSSASPADTWSPSAFSQRTIVPSSIESARRGMTSTIISVRTLFLWLGAGAEGRPPLEEGVRVESLQVGAQCSLDARGLAAGDVPEEDDLAVLDADDLDVVDAIRRREEGWTASRARDDQPVCGARLHARHAALADRACAACSSSSSPW